jgi:hypothetical protein
VKKLFKYLAVFCLVVLTSIITVASDATPDPVGARQLFELVNQDRAKAGLAPLAWDSRLAEAALKHNELMAEKQALSHQFSGEPSLRLRLAQTSIRLDSSGENVAYDTTVEGANISLMNSPPHRANILSRAYNAVGISVIRRGEYFYVVEDFAHRLPEMTVAQVEGEIAANFNRLRENSGLRAMSWSSVSGLREAACGMAKNDAVDARSVQVAGARHLVSFTMSDPSQLPSSLVRLSDSSEIGRFDIGVCFERTPTYPSGVYWAVMALFPKDRGAAGNR